MFDLVFIWLQSCKEQEASESAFIATADKLPGCRRKAGEGPGTNLLACKPISCSLVTYNPVPMRASDLSNLPPRGSVIPIQSILFEIQADLTGVF